MVITLKGEMMADAPSTVLTTAILNCPLGMKITSIDHFTKRDTYTVWCGDDNDEILKMICMDKNGEVR